MVTLWQFWTGRSQTSCCVGGRQQRGCCEEVWGCVDPRAAEKGCCECNQHSDHIAGDKHSLVQVAGMLTARQTLATEDRMV